MSLRLSSKNSNIYLKRLLVASCLIVCFVHTTYALDPNRSIAQYIHDVWGSDKGFPGGPVNAITQTPDGYLWIAIAKGLLRFDGLNFKYFQHSNTPELPAGPVLGLAVDSEGTLWIRSQGASLLLYREGKFENIEVKLPVAEPGVTAMGNATNGEILLTGLVNGTVRYSGGKFLSIAKPVPLPNFLAISIAEGSKGEVWLGTRDIGLYSINREGVASFANVLPDRKINCLLPTSNDGLWIGTDNGVARWDGANVTNIDLDAASNRVQVLAMIRDRDANVWLGTTSGVFRINAQGNVSTKTDRIPKLVSSLYEDREGNIWAGTSDSLERLRDSVFVSYSVSGGMPSDNHGPIYIDKRNRTWFGPATGGLYWMKDGVVTRATTVGIGEDVVYSITGFDNDLWIGRQRGGLTYLHDKEGIYKGQTYTTSQGLAQNSVYSVARSRDGTVWAGTLSGGISRLRNGKLTTFTTNEGLPSNTIDALLESSDGTMWVATPNGVSSFSQDHWKTFQSKDGLPSERVNCLLEDATGSLWVGTDAGIAFFSNGRFIAPTKTSAAVNEPILGLADDKLGSLWITTPGHVLRVNRDALLRDAVGEGDIHEYGLADGLKSTEGVKRNQSVRIDPNGMIWLSLNTGLSVVDPRRLTKASPAALVNITGLTVDGISLGLSSGIKIPASPKRISLSFSGLSLAIPERVRFRYKLDSLESAWSQPIGAGEAIYSNLGPGHYRFHVIASNSEGVWNSTEGTIAFEIAPAMWQTWWFRIVGLIVVSFSVLALYRLRLHQLTKQLNVRFEERLAERTLIAQELHDTLLQGFLSASMQLDVAVDNLPASYPDTPRFLRVLELMREVIEEGRNALRGLRSVSPGSSANLEDAFARVKQELGTVDHVAFRVIAEGSARPIHALVRDEVYRIGREAVVNAFRHSKATEIEVGVAYLRNHLRIVVNDNGSGIDPVILESGRDGHWGLSGMRERSERIGAQLRVKSKVGGGTEVELTVPSSAAFPDEGSNRLLRWLRLIRMNLSGTLKTAKGKEND